MTTHEDKLAVSKSLSEIRRGMQDAFTALQMAMCEHQSAMARLERRLASTERELIAPSQTFRVPPSWSSSSWRMASAKVPPFRASLDLEQPLSAPKAVWMDTEKDAKNDRKGPGNLFANHVFFTYMRSGLKIGRRQASKIWQSLEKKEKEFFEKFLPLYRASGKKKDAVVHKIREDSEFETMQARILALSKIHADSEDQNPGTEKHAQISETKRAEDHTLPVPLSAAYGTKERGGEKNKKKEREEKENGAEAVSAPSDAKKPQALSATKRAFVKIGDLTEDSSDSDADSPAPPKRARKATRGYGEDSFIVPDDKTLSTEESSESETDSPRLLKRKRSPPRTFGSLEADIRHYVLAKDENDKAPLLRRFNALRAQIGEFGRGEISIRESVGHLAEKDQIVFTELPRAERDTCAFCRQSHPCRYSFDGGDLCVSSNKVGRFCYLRYMALVEFGKLHTLILTARLQDDISDSQWIGLAKKFENAENVCTEFIAQIEDRRA